MRIERADNSIYEKIRQLTGKRSWTNLFTGSKRVPLKIRAEMIDFDRAEVFIGDLNKKTGGAFAMFTVEHLIIALYADFLYHIRENLNELKVDKDTLTQEETVYSLIKKRNMYFPRQKNRETDNNFVNPRQWALLEIKLQRENAQRGEVFLYDAGTVYPEFDMSLTELISILFVDFVAQLRRGNQQILVNALIEKFFYHDFE